MSRRYLDKKSIGKQGKTVEHLKAENTRLKDEMLLENKFSSAPTNPAATAQIAKLQDQADMFTRKTELEKRRVAELDKQISMMNQKIMEQRKKMGGINAARENNQQIQKQIKILENRLEKALVKYNEAIASNKNLREQIDNLRRERLVFDQIYKKLEHELQEKKLEMSNIVQVSSMAYDARNQALHEMETLKEQANKEQAAFETEWRDLSKLIDNDRRMKELIRKENEPGPKRGDMTIEEETKLRKKVIKGQWGIAKDKVAQHVSMEKVQSYGEAFAKIQAATGINDIDELVTTFINSEDQNFSLFNYVNELNQEIEKLEEQISDTKAEIEKYKGQGVNADNQRKKILKDLEERLAKTEGKADSYEKKYEGSMKTVNSHKSGIWNIFNKIGCNTPEVSEMLGEGGVTESNMMQYLGIIEQRTNEILQLYATSQPSGGDQGGNQAFVMSILGQGPQVPAGSVSMGIEAPSTTEVYDDDDSEDEAEDERPLNREEISQKVSRRIQRRDTSGKGVKAKGGKKTKD